MGQAYMARIDIVSSSPAITRESLLRLIPTLFMARRDASSLSPPLVRARSEAGVSGQKQRWSGEEGAPHPRLSRELPPAFLLEQGVICPFRRLPLACQPSSFSPPGPASFIFDPCLNV